MYVGSRLKRAWKSGRRHLKSLPSSRTGENPPYGMIGGVEETSASFEARSAPRSYPTHTILIQEKYRKRMTDMTDLVTLFPRQRVPPLDVGLADGGTFDIAAEKPASFTLIVFYRGLHCPICKTQLRELESKLDEFDKRG